MKHLQKTERLVLKCKTNKKNKKMTVKIKAVNTNKNEQLNSTCSKWVGLK